MESGCNVDLVVGEAELWHPVIVKQDANAKSILISFPCPVELKPQIYRTSVGLKRGLVPIDQRHPVFSLESAAQRRVEGERGRKKLGEVLVLGTCGGSAEEQSE